MKSTLVISFLLSLLSFTLFTANAAKETIVIDNIEYRTIASISKMLAMKLSTTDSGKRIVLKNKRSEIDFTNRSRSILINHRKIYLGFPVLHSKDNHYITVSDWENTIRPILLPLKLEKKQKKLSRIVIDPGHGGKDPGAHNDPEQIKEKDLTLKVSKLVQQRLKKAGYKVYLTRSKDKFIELNDRPKYATKKKADLFVSIHFNASSSPSSNGIETFGYTLRHHPSTNRSKATVADSLKQPANKFDPLNALFAYTIQNNLVGRTDQTDRGFKRARFTVLETLECPGALLELGFINNPKTVKKIKQPEYLELLANSITDSIVQYHQRIDPA